MNPALPKNNWRYVYLLSSNKTVWIYIGCTSDLQKRIKEHKDGKVYSTKKMLPLELIYYEAYRSNNCADEREKNLKTYGSALGKLKARIGVNPALSMEKRILQ